MALKKDFQYEYKLRARLQWGEVCEARTILFEDAYIKVASVEGAVEC